MPPDDSLRSILLQMLNLMREQNREIAKLHASIAAHRRAIAATVPESGAAETQLRQFEIDTQALAISAQGFPEADAIAALLKAGKNPDSLDS
jgi:hypothetical protein